MPPPLSCVFPAMRGAWLAPTTDAWNGLWLGVAPPTPVDERVIQVNGVECLGFCRQFRQSGFKLPWPLANRRGACRAGASRSPIWWGPAPSRCVWTSGARIITCDQGGGAGAGQGDSRYRPAIAGHGVRRDLPGADADGLIPGGVSAGLGAKIPFLVGVPRFFWLDVVNNELGTLNISAIAQVVREQAPFALSDAAQAWARWRSIWELAGGFDVAFPPINSTAPRASARFMSGTRGASCAGADPWWAVHEAVCRSGTLALIRLPRWARPLPAAECFRARRRAFGQLTPVVAAIGRGAGAAFEMAAPASLPPYPDLRSMKSALAMNGSRVTIDERAEARGLVVGYVCPSFSTSRVNANGAMPHFHATAEELRYTRANACLLIDSGGSTWWYTDYAVVPVGTSPARAERDCTRVLKGVIALSAARFSAGILSLLLGCPIVGAPSGPEVFDLWAMARPWLGYFSMCMKARRSSLTRPPPTPKQRCNGNDHLDRTGNLSSGALGGADRELGAEPRAVKASLGVSQAGRWTERLGMATWNQRGSEQGGASVNGTDRSDKQRCDHHPQCRSLNAIGGTGLLPEQNIQCPAYARA
ncbi:hypothetical protein FQR65_LT20959 [Abscondita terminalis]|nr:hypothetical protein FQR65_LT20959 [Abscondita terminalis]